MPFTTGDFKVTTGNGRDFILLEPVTYVTSVHGFLEKIEVPSGAASDGASIPSEAWSIPGFAPFGVHWKAAFVHDYLYRQTDWSREDCDKVFLEAMVNAGVDTLHAQAIYEAVRAFGQSAFDKDRGEK